MCSYILSSFNWNKNLHSLKLHQTVSSPNVFYFDIEFGKLTIYIHMHIFLVICIIMKSPFLQQNPDYLQNIKCFKVFFKAISEDLCYIRHLTVVMNHRISSAVSQEDDPAVLLNGHFDSPPSSPGAADCGSCVGGLNYVCLLLFFVSVMAHNLV